MNTPLFSIPHQEYGKTRLEAYHMHKQVLSQTYKVEVDFETK